MEQYQCQNNVNVLREMIHMYMKSNISTQNQLSKMQTSINSMKPCENQYTDFIWYTFNALYLSDEYANNMTTKPAGCQNHDHSWI